MRKFLFFLVLLLAACNISEIKTSPPEVSKKAVIKLKDGLGVVSLLLPARYDTTFSWIHYSDCGAPCEKRKYRYQPRNLPVYMETGFHYKPLNDSIEQFTIVHNPYIFPGDSDKTDNKDYIISFHDHKKFYITHDPTLRTIKWDTIEKIGDRYFSVIVIDNYDTATSEYSKKLLSSTTIKRGTIDFDFELLSKKRDSLTKNFIDDAKYYLRTIRIENTNK